MPSGSVTQAKRPTPSISSTPFSSSTSAPSARSAREQGVQVVDAEVEHRLGAPGAQVLALLVEERDDGDAALVSQHRGPFIERHPELLDVEGAQRSRVPSAAKDAADAGDAARVRPHAAGSAKKAIAAKCAAAAAITSTWKISW